MPELRNNRYAYVCLICILASGCRAPAELSEGFEDQIIVDASAVTYSELTSEERERVGNYASFSTGGWSSHDLTRFEPSDAFYVRARIDLETLARLTLLNSCGSAIQGRRCSERVLRERTLKFASQLNPHLSYGKYKNSWAFYYEDGLMPSTEKFDGHRTLKIERDPDRSEDDVLIGPLPFKPIEIQLQAYRNWTEDHGSIKNARRKLEG